jgi:hypothetical protein
MRCVECTRAKEGEERGWVTVLSPSGAVRIHYCPACMMELVQRSYAVNDEGDLDDA